MDNYESIVKSEYPPPVRTDESYIKKLQGCRHCGKEWSMVSENKVCPSCGSTDTYSQHPQLRDTTKDPRTHIH